MKSPSLAKRQSPTPEVFPRRTLTLAEQLYAWPAFTLMLTIEEFAEYMQVSVTLIHQWMREGILKRGRHYIKPKYSRTIRFPLGEALIEKLLEDSLLDEGLADDELYQNRSSTKRQVERKQKKPALSAVPKRETSSTRVVPRGNTANVSPVQKSQGPPSRCPIDPAYQEQFFEKSLN